MNSLERWQGTLQRGSTAHYTSRASSDSPALLSVAPCSLSRFRRASLPSLAPNQSVRQKESAQDIQEEKHLGSPRKKKASNQNTRTLCLTFITLCATYLLCTYGTSSDFLSALKFIKELLQYSFIFDTFTFHLAWKILKRKCSNYKRKYIEAVTLKNIYLNLILYNDSLKYVYWNGYFKMAEMKNCIKLSTQKICIMV